MGYCIKQIVVIHPSQHIPPNSQAPVDILCILHLPHHWRAVVRMDILSIPSPIHACAMDKHKQASYKSSPMQR